MAWNTVPQFRGEHHKMPGWNGNVEILSLLDCNPQWIEQKTSLWLVVSCQQEMLKWHGQSSCPWFRGNNLPDAPCKKIERPWILPMLQCEWSHFGNGTRRAWPKGHAMMNLPQMWRLNAKLVQNQSNWCDKSCDLMCGHTVTDHHCVISCAESQASENESNQTLLRLWLCIEADTSQQSTMMKDVFCSHARNNNVKMKVLFLDNPMDKEDE